MKLWETESNLDSLIERFTVGIDPELDMRLIPYDCKASIAHARMLHSIGVLNDGEKDLLVNELNEIAVLWERGEFSISVGDEDGHTAIENHLTKKLGEPGKKIHTGRSRNDQVLTALRLYEKEKLLSIIDSLKSLIGHFSTFSDENTNIGMPGFTHTRKAMPYTIGSWAESFKMGLDDSQLMLETCLKFVDRNPLGTGAGFGVPIPLDREMTTQELGFNGMIANSLNAQNSRGKIESYILHNCLMVLYDLSKWSSDLILFTMPEFNYFTLDDSITTGSSIMPHKKNPDVLELIRASYSIVEGFEQQSRNLTAKMISGYHRDMQWSKEPVMRGLELTLEVVRVSIKVIETLSVNRDSLENSMTDELVSVQEVMRLVEEGVPFREAYQIVSKKFK